MVHAGTRSGDSAEASRPPSFGLAGARICSLDCGEGPPRRQRAGSISRPHCRPASHLQSRRLIAGPRRVQSSGRLAPDHGAVERAVASRVAGPILLNRRGARMDRHAATRRLRRLATTANVRLPRMHPHMLRHAFVTTMLDSERTSTDTQLHRRRPRPPAARPRPATPRQSERSRCQPHERGAGAGRTARPPNPSTLTAGQRLAYSARCRRVRRATPVSTSTTPPMARAQSPVPTPV